jgi:hypothetical protein
LKGNRATTGQQGNKGNRAICKGQQGNRVTGHQAGQR